MLNELLKRQKDLSRQAGIRAENLHRLPGDAQAAEETEVNALYLELFETERRIRVLPAQTVAQAILKLGIAVRYAVDELGEAEQLDENWLMAFAVLEDLELIGDESLSRPWRTDVVCESSTHVFPGGQDNQVEPAAAQVG